MSWKEFKSENEPEEEKLAGDQLEEILHDLGADNLARLYEEVSGNDCGCDKRKDWLNKLHRRFKDWWNNNWS